MAKLENTSQLASLLFSLYQTDERVVPKKIRKRSTIKRNRNKRSCSINNVSPKKRKRETPPKHPQQIKISPWNDDSHLAIFNIAYNHVKTYREYIWIYNYCDPSIFDDYYLNYILCTHDGRAEKSALALNIYMMIAHGALLNKDMAIGDEYYHKARLQVADLFDLTEYSVAEGLLKMGAFADGLLELQQRNYYLTLGMAICERLGAKDSIVYHNCYYMTGIRSLMLDGRDSDFIIHKELWSPPNSLQTATLELPGTNQIAMSVNNLGLVHTAVHLLWRVVYVVTKAWDKETESLDDIDELNRAQNERIFKKNENENNFAKNNQRKNTSTCPEIITIDSSDDDEESEDNFFNSTSTSPDIHIPTDIPTKRDNLSPSIREGIEQLLRCVERLEKELVHLQYKSQDPIPPHIYLDLLLGTIGLCARIHWLLGEKEKAIQRTLQFILESKTVGFRFVHRAVVGVAALVLDMLIEMNSFDLGTELLNQIEQFSQKLEIYSIYI
eukprot:TRINITY_DN7847_c0_g1_i1.p1 TRINITY_DN7847_c0_g1~~TRINITY_DN7847_c0_g1_i1.p1  ORF type:complete len:498 (+),score=60.03 TRINITY_DN7847_c0_g1_i1:119-1612(+)